MSKYYIEQEYEFIPQCDSDVTFTLRALTANQRDECISSRIIGGEVEMTINKTKLFRYGVKEIENLEVNDKKIKTANDFLNNVVPAIYEEVCSKIIEASAKKDLKN